MPYPAVGPAVAVHVPVVCDEVQELAGLKLPKPVCASSPPSGAGPESLGCPRSGPPQRVTQGRRECGMNPLDRHGAAAIVLQLLHQRGHLIRANLKFSGQWRHPLLRHGEAAGRKRGARSLWDGDHHRDSQRGRDSEPHRHSWHQRPPYCHRNNGAQRAYHPRRGHHPCDSRR